MQVEQRAIDELRVLVYRLGDELASFRRRALTAEAKLKEVESTENGAASIELSRRIADLEEENERLRAQVDGAGARARQMLDRVKFLRQQTQSGSVTGAGSVDR